MVSCVSIANSRSINSECIQFGYHNGVGDGSSYVLPNDEWWERKAKSESEKFWYDYGNEQPIPQLKNIALCLFPFVCHHSLLPFHLPHLGLAHILQASQVVPSSDTHKHFSIVHLPAPHALQSTSIDSAVANERTVRPSIFIVSLLNRPGYVSLGTTIKLIAVCSPWTMFHAGCSLPKTRIVLSLHNFLLSPFPQTSACWNFF